MKNFKPVVPVVEGKNEILKFVADLEGLIRQELAVERNPRELIHDSEYVCSVLQISTRTLQNYRSKRLIDYCVVGTRAYYSDTVVRLLQELKEVQKMQRRVRTAL